MSLQCPGCSGMLSGDVIYRSGTRLMALGIVVSNGAVQGKAPGGVEDVVKLCTQLVQLGVLPVRDKSFIHDEGGEEYAYEIASATLPHGPTVSTHFRPHYPPECSELDLFIYTPAEPTRGPFAGKDAWVFRSAVGTRWREGPDAPVDPQLESPRFRRAFLDSVPTWLRGMATRAIDTALGVDASGVSTPG
jgi:hypothetical protein